MNSYFNINLPNILFLHLAMGPILPQINVFGKQLGISPDIMGLITSVLPLLYVLAKPAVGFLIDYFSVSLQFVCNFHILYWRVMIRILPFFFRQSVRKAIFMMIILTMTLSYACFFFVPIGIVHKVPIRAVYNFSMDSIDGCLHVDQVSNKKILYLQSMFATYCSL